MIKITQSQIPDALGIEVQHRALEQCRNGTGLYAKACEFDLEGIVAKIEKRQLHR